MITKAMPSLCFDLDGTLVDTAPDLVRVLNDVITEEGLPPTEYDAARASVGRGARTLIVEASERAGHPLSAQREDELVGLFLKLYAQDIARLSRPYPGVVATLRDLKASGAQLSVCTNKPGFLARPLLGRLELTGFFRRIKGSEDVSAKKPAAGHIFAAAGHRRSGSIIMIGDSSPDVHAAKAANVPVIIMSYGYSDQPVNTLRADKILHSFRDLPDMLNSMGYLQ